MEHPKLNSFYVHRRHVNGKYLCSEPNDGTGAI
jgi:hypothetical protein